MRKSATAAGCCFRPAGHGRYYYGAESRDAGRAVSRKKPTLRRVIPVGSRDPPACPPGAFVLLSRRRDPAITASRRLRSACYGIAPRQGTVAAMRPAVASPCGDYSVDIPAVARGVTLRWVTPFPPWNTRAESAIFASRRQVVIGGREVPYAQALIGCSGDTLSFTALG